MPRYISIEFDDAFYARIEREAQAMGVRPATWCRVAIGKALPTPKAVKVPKVSTRPSHREVMEERWRQWAMMPVAEILADPLFIIQPKSKRRALLTQIERQDAQSA